MNPENIKVISKPFRAMASRFEWHTLNRTVVDPKVRVYTALPQWYGLQFIVFETDQPENVLSAADEIARAYDEGFSLYEATAKSLTGKRALSDIEKNLIYCFDVTKGYRDEVTGGKPISNWSESNGQNKLPLGNLIDFLSGKLEEWEREGSISGRITRNTIDQLIARYRQIREVLQENSTKDNILIFPPKTQLREKPQVVESNTNLSGSRQTAMEYYTKRDIDYDRLIQRLAPKDKVKELMEIGTPEWEKRSRNRWLPWVILIAGSAILLALCDYRNKSASAPIINSNPDGQGITTAGDNIQEVEQPQILMKHWYRNQPDENGVYGSLWGHAEYELAKVLDVTIADDEKALGRSIDSFDPRIEKVLNEFEKSNPEEFEKIMDEYTSYIKENNKEVIKGEDAIVSPQFESEKISEVFERVREEVLTAKGWVR